MKTLFAATAAALFALTLSATAADLPAFCSDPEKMQEPAYQAECRYLVEASAIDTELKDITAMLQSMSEGIKRANKVLDSMGK